ncbi:hypothetical protein ACS3QZ_08040 [Shimia sp. W99]
MALILIFVGSFIGIIVATIQMLFQDATLWQGLVTYMTFSLGFPLLTGLLTWGLSGLRTPSHDAEEYGWHKA